MNILTVKELAEYLKCSVSSVRCLVRNRQIPFFRIGSKLCFHQEAIDNWIYAEQTKNQSSILEVQYVKKI